MFNQAVLDKMWANRHAATLAFIWSQACVHMMNVKSSSRSAFTFVSPAHRNISLSYSHWDAGDWLSIHTCMTGSFLVSSMLHATASLPITIATSFCLKTICRWSRVRANSKYKYVLLAKLTVPEQREIFREPVSDYNIWHAAGGKRFEFWNKTSV